MAARISGFKEERALPLALKTSLCCPQTEISEERERAVFTARECCEAVSD